MRDAPEDPAGKAGETEPAQRDDRGAATDRRQIALVTIAERARLGLAFLGNAMADDEILKNAFSSFAFENFEIASYMSLIAMAEACGSPSIPALDQSLREERAMADWIEANVVMITRRYVDLSASGQPAKI